MQLSERRLRRIASEVRGGLRSPRALISALRRLPYENLGFARIDTHRGLRRGLPEVIYCDGKSASQLARIVRRFDSAHEAVLLTRLSADVFQDIQSGLPALRYDPIARLAYRPWRGNRRLKGLVAVVTGGTSDLAVAEEAALTLQFLGSRVARLYDVGVAGIHRLFDQLRLLRRARAIVVIAGMEGALASVVAGLVACPVVAVPTSVGYGAHFQGLASLLSMLNSCVPGVGVVNIDNGFGAGYLAHVINQPPVKGS